MSERLWFRGALLGATYAYAAVSIALVGLVMPLAGLIGADAKVSPAAIGQALAWFSLPAAALGAVCVAFGGMGAQAAFVMSAALEICGDMVIAQYPGIWTFRFGLMLSGAGSALVVTTVSMPMMAGLPPAARLRVLAFWPSFAPTGFAAGLLLALPFLCARDWQAAFVGHVALTLLALAVVLAILGEGASAKRDGGDNPAPRTQAHAVLRPGARAVGQGVALTLAFVLPWGVSYGTGLVAPHCFAMHHGVSLPTSIAEFAVLQLAVVMIGAWMLAARPAWFRHDSAMFLAAAAAGIAAQIVLMWPGADIGVASMGLIGWMAAAGTLGCLTMLSLGRAMAPAWDVARVARLVGPIASLQSFIVPGVYFSTERWMCHVAVATSALVAGALAFLLIGGREPRRAGWSAGR